MKTKIINHLVIAFIILLSALSKCQAQETIEYLTRNDSAHQAAKFSWGEFNAGYSNHGPAGSLTLNFRKGNLIFSTQYNKSHTCYDDNKRRRYFVNDGKSDNDETAETMSVLSGIVLPGKLSPSLTIGVSWCRFKYVSTVQIEHEVTLSRIWATVINRDYPDETVSSRTVNAIGIPMEIKLHLAPKHFVGFDIGLKADINMQSTIVSAELGIRLGRVTRRLPK